MYSREEKLKAVELFTKYDKNRLGDKGARVSVPRDPLRVARGIPGERGRHAVGRYRLPGRSIARHVFVDRLAVEPEIAGDFPVRPARQVHLDGSHLIRQIDHLQSPLACSIRRSGWPIFKLNCAPNLQ